MHDLQTTNYLSFLIEFCFSILFLFIFAAVHYAIVTKSKLGKSLDKSKAANFWYFFIFGALLSSITFGVSQLTTISINATIGLPVTILSLIFAMSLFYNRSLQIGALIPQVIWVLWAYDGFYEATWAWGARLIVVFIVFAVAFVASFLKTKKWPTFLISLVILMALCVAVVFIFKDEELQFHLIELAVSFGSAILFFAFVNWFNNMLSNMTYMARNTTYTDHYYVISSLIQSRFKILINETKSSQALVATFYIKNKSEKLLNSIANKFKEKGAMLFKTSYDTYGVVLTDNNYYIKDLNKSLEGNRVNHRSIEDPLIRLENILKDLNIWTFVSIYGVHSNDFDELLKFNQYAIRQFSANMNYNRIQLFDSNMLNNKIQDEINYAQLIEKINLNDINVELEVIETIDKQKYVCPRFYWVKSFTCNIDEIIEQFDLTTSNALLRSLAIKSLEKYSLSNYKDEIPILIYYPIKELTNQYFSINQFIKKINSYDVNINNVVLSFNCKKIRLWPRSILNNLVELQANNVKFMFTNLINTYCLTQVKPVALILDETVEKNQKKLNNALEICKQYNQNVLLTKYNN